MSVAGVTPRILRPEHPAPRPIAGLVDAFELQVDADLDGVEVTGITIDSSDGRATSSRRCRARTGTAPSSRPRRSSAVLSPS